MSKLNKRLRSQDAFVDSPIGENLNFAAAEAYKLLRANLTFSLPANEGGCKVVGITSSVPSEGKSTTAINLAYSIAETGKKVLLIDADMRLPTLYRRLGIASSPGLSNLLAGLSNGADVLRSSGLHENLHAIVAGDIPPNPNELLASDMMGRLIKSLSSSYDYIIFDLPPVTSVSDGLVISDHLDGVIVVVRRNFCDKHSLQEAMRYMRFRNVKILGFVLTRSQHHGKYYKRSSNNSYKYGRQYSKIKSPVSFDRTDKRK